MKLDHVTISVTSLSASEPYYAALLPLLGFAPTRPGVWANEDGFAFQFIEAKPGTRPYERYGAGLNHLGFPAESERQVVEIQERMRASGFEAPEIQHLDGATALFMRDPDGIRFEVTYYPPT